MDILLSEITAEAPADFPWSTTTVLTAIGRHRLSDEEPASDEDDDDDDDDEDWDDEDLDDDDDWDEDDDDDDWDDDDDDDETPANLVTPALSPAVARS